MTTLLILPQLLLLILLNEHPLAQKAVPDDILKRVRKAQTFDELLSFIQLSHEPYSLGSEDEPTFKVQKLHSAEIRSYTDSVRTVKPYKAFTLLPSTITRTSAFRQDINERKSYDANATISLDILSTIRQGTDICELQKACIPILPENPDPGLLIFPRCYEVTQCIGSCCEFTEHCHPISIEYIHQPIIEMLYSGNNLFVINQTRNITIERHTACSCQECSEFGAAIQCPRTKNVGGNCKCECRNREEKKDCQGPNKVWNDETCTCSCATNSCYGKSILDSHTCLCYHPGNSESYGELNSSDNFRLNTSRLQRLGPARRRTTINTP